jgi:hypothetical protein
MAFGISYTPKPMPFGLTSNVATRYKIIFRYNNPGNQVFAQIKNINQASNLTDYATSGANLLRDIRIFNNEKITIETGVDSKGFPDRVVFDAIMPSKDTFNIFISLVPLSELGINGTTSLEAEILAQFGEKWISVGSASSMPSIASDNAHDPNQISVSPEFISLPQTTQTLHYTIDFQNTGLGDADTVKVVFYCPAQMNELKKIWNLKASYSEITDFKTIDTQYEWNSGRIIFTLIPVEPITGIKYFLDGTRNIPNPINNPLTMGQISFDLEILPGNDIHRQEILHAWAEIYFRGIFPSDCAITNNMVSEKVFISGTNEYEIPVRTRDACTVYSGSSKSPAVCTCQSPRGVCRRIKCAFRALFHGLFSKKR